MKKTRVYLLVFILILSSFAHFVPFEFASSENNGSFGYTALETLEMYNASISSSRYFDGANHHFITPFGNFSFLQPGNIMRFTNYEGELIVEKSVLVLQYDSYGSWLPLLDFVNIQTTSTDSQYSFEYDLNNKYRGQNYVVGNVRIDFNVNGLNKPKISVDFNKTEYWMDPFGDPDFRWMWDVVPYVDEYDDGWKYWKNGTETVDITHITGSQELGNLTRLQFTDNTTTTLSAFLDVSDYGATIFEGGDETYWNSKGFVAVFPVNVADIDPSAYTQTIEAITPGDTTGWQEVDAGAAPANSVAEIIATNDHTTAPQAVGVRDTAEAVTKTLSLCKAEGGGVTAARFLINVDSSGNVDLFRDIVNVGYTLVGYWTDVTWTDQWDDHKVTRNDDDMWFELPDGPGDLGLVADRVHLITLVNENAGTEDYLGVRNTSSAVERRTQVMEAEGGGAQVSSMYVTADGSGNIDVYTADYVDVYFINQGYFEAAVDFSDRFDYIGGAGDDDSWSDWDISAYIDTDGLVCDFLSSNREIAEPLAMGVRKNGVADARYFVLRNAEGNGGSPYGMSAQTDGEGIVEIWNPIHVEIGINPTYYMAGYFNVGGEEGEQYSRDVSQSLSWSGVGARTTWSSLRVLGQSLTFTWTGTKGIWSTSRLVSLSLSHAFTALRDWTLLRVLSQSLTTSFTAFREWTLLRTFSQSLTFVWNGLREITILRELTIALTTSFNAFREWTLLRTLTQSFTFTWDAIGELIAAQQYLREMTLSLTNTWDLSRIWSTSKDLTQSFTFTWTPLREWTLLRSLTQSLSLSWDSFREWTTLRAFSLSLTTTWNALREWSLLRTVTQSLTTSFEAIRIWTLSRTIIQSLTFVWNAYGEIISGNFFSRTVTLSLTNAFNGLKGAWALSRVITQPIITSFNALREWTLLRIASQSITFTWNAYGSRFITYLFNLRVTDSLLPLANAIVQILQGESTIWTGQTFVNGSIVTQALPQNNYSLYVELDGYLPYENLLNLANNVNWDVALTAITFNIVFLGFMFLASAAMYIGWTRETPTESLWAYFFSLLFWIATIYQWNIDHGTDNPAFMYLFFFPILSLIFFIYEEATKYYEESMQGYKNDPFG